MCISGFWHGANWNFLIWGLIHGIALALNHMNKAKKININLNPLISRIILLVFINISFIVFKTTDLNSLKLVLLSLLPFKNIFNYFGFNINSINIHFSEIPILIIFLSIVLFLPSSLNILGYRISKDNKIEVKSVLKKLNLNSLQIFMVSSLVTLMFLLSVSQIHLGQEFIYFQF